MFDVYKNLFSSWVELWTWITCLGWYQNQADEPVSPCQGRNPDVKLSFE